MLSEVRGFTYYAFLARALLPTVACFPSVVFRLSFLFESGRLIVLSFLFESGRLIVLSFLFESGRLIVLSFLLWEERASLAGELRTGGLDTGIKGRAQ